jgi:Response regulator containing CheY-like receiver, AAA-type ATPase, and DNA-binding domains
MKILIADLDQNFISDIQHSWSIPDTDFVVCSDKDAFMPLAKNQPVDLAFIEVPFLMLENMDMVSYLKERHPGIEIYVLCNDKNWPGATSAISRGASSFLMKPLSISQLEDVAKKALAQQQNKSTAQLMESQVLDSLLGNTPEMRKILKTVYKIAPTTSTVLITGESGSGKEFLAKIVHRYSKRSEAPLSPSTAAPFRRTWSKVNSLAARRARTPVPPPTRRVCSNLQTVAHCSSTKSANFPRQRKSSSCVSCRTTRYAAWAKPRVASGRARHRGDKPRTQGRHARRPVPRRPYYRLNTFHLQLRPCANASP